MDYQKYPQSLSSKHLNATQPGLVLHHNILLNCFKNVVNHLKSLKNSVVNLVEELSPIDLRNCSIRFRKVIAGLTHFDTCKRDHNKDLFIYYLPIYPFIYLPIYLFILGFKSSSTLYRSYRNG